MFAFIPLSLLALAGLTLAQSGTPSGTNCNGKYFSGSKIYTAIQDAVNDQNSGYSPDNYPHAYYQESTEDISLVCSEESGGYYEFPLTDTQPYKSSNSNYVSPGAYRVIYTGDGEYCASVYHDNNGSEFAQCDDE